MRLIRAREIKLMWDGNQICALIGPDLHVGVGGFGDDVPDALLDLVGTIQADDDTTVWVPRHAVQYREDGVLKCQCPECGHIRVMHGFDRVIAYICPACGESVDVLPLADGEHDDEPPPDEDEHRE